jgi:asparagine synthetase B (glutamine-hydrolysing)
MCGLFGFFGSTPDSSPDFDTFLRVALAAGQRGPESFGVYARFPDLSQKTVRHALPLSENLALLDEFAGASLLVGHARLATSGSATNAVQPLVISGGSTRVVLAHNGNIINDRALADEFDLNPQTSCDSEVLALLIARGLVHSLVHSPLPALRYALDLIEPAPLALLACADGHVFIARSRLPLFQLVRPEGVYFCSVVFDAACEALPDDSVCHIGEFGAPLPSLTVLPLRRSSTMDSSSQRARKEKSAPRGSGWQQLPLPPDRC